MKVVSVPKRFQPAINVTYPPHQRGLLIEEYAERFFANLDSLATVAYLPVKWTAFHVNNGYGKQVGKLLEYVDSLPSGKYITVCQYDGGTLVHEKLKEKGCVVFNCNAPVGVPIPLLCDPHPISLNTPKKNLACFVGSLETHPIRQIMAAELGQRPGYVFAKGKGRDGTQMFRKIMNDSHFALCPRGYEASSFRLYEAIQMGVVPVYISDVHYMPFKDVVDWYRLAVVADDKGADVYGAMDATLRRYSTGTIQDKSRYCLEVYRKYFNMQGTCREIERMVAKKSWEQLLNT